MGSRWPWRSMKTCSGPLTMISLMSVSNRSGAPSVRNSAQPFAIRYRIDRSIVSTSTPIKVNPQWTALLKPEASHLWTKS